jgi:T5orf172 domain
MPKLSSREPDAEAYGFVYFFGHESTGPVKVGFTSNKDVKYRLKQLQTGNPEKLEVLGTVPAYAQIERSLHRFLTPHGIRGEWFDREVALVLLRRLDLKASHHPGEFVKKIALVHVETLYYPGEQEEVEPLQTLVAQAFIDDWVHQLRRVNTELSLPLRTWLQSQLGKDTPTGDLAKDALADPSFPEVGTLQSYLTYICTHRSKSEQIRAAVQAWVECDIEIDGLRYRDEDIYDWSAPR